MTETAISLRRLPRRVICGLFAVALGVGWSICSLNLAYVKHTNPANAERNIASTVLGYTIWSVDNVFYVSQIRNYLAGDGFLIEPSDPASSYRRTPAYPLFFGAHYVLFGEAGAFRFIRYTQLLLNATAAVLLAHVCLWLTNSRRAAVIAGLLYAINPFTAIYSYFTITESLQPFFSTLALAASTVAALRLTPTSLIVSGMAVAALTLTRPTGGLQLPSAGLALIAGRCGRPLRRSSGKLLLLGLGFLMLVGPWAARNYVISGGRTVPLEEYERLMDWGDGYEAFRRWWTTWDVVDARTTVGFHRSLQRASGSTSVASADRLAKEFADRLPPDLFDGAARQDIESGVRRLAACVATNARDVVPAMECDTTVARFFQARTASLQSDRRVYSYVVVPMRRLRHMLFHSFSSAFACLNPAVEGLSLVQIIVKTAMYALNVGLWLAFVVFLIVHKDRQAVVALGIFPIALVTFFAWFFRINFEERYLIAAYPFLFASAGCLVDRVLDRAGVRSRSSAPAASAS